MERPKQNTTEKFSKGVDLLNENTRVTYDISEESVSHLPVLSAGETAYILGTIEKRQGRAVHISVELSGNEASDSDDDSGALQDRADARVPNPALTRDRVEALADAHPEFEGRIFLGELRSGTPNESDLLALRDAYLGDEFKPYEPCLVGVAKRGETGEPTLRLFRMIRAKQKPFYELKEVERVEKPTG